MFKIILETYDGYDKDIIEARLSGAWDMLSQSRVLALGTQDCRRWLYTGCRFGSGLPAVGRVPLPTLRGKEIAHSPELYPLTVVGVAERTLAEKTGTKLFRSEV